MSVLKEELNKYGDVKEGICFKDLTTIRIGGEIEYLFCPKDVESLILALNHLKAKGIAYKILGFGSNLVCGDTKYEGCVINLKHFDKYEIEDATLKVQAGMSAIKLAKLTASLGLSGLEFASGIPGSIGGLVYMNAGAYKKEMADIVMSVGVITAEGYQRLSLGECQYQYRTSIFQKHPTWIIVDATLRLDEGNKEEIEALNKKRAIARNSSQPLDKRSAGSCFRNPEGRSAWELIDGVGLRGYRIGDIAVSEKHSNFIINEGKATASDFIALTSLIQTRVKEKYDVELYREVELFNC